MQEQKREEVEARRAREQQGEQNEGGKGMEREEGVGKSRTNSERKNSIWRETGK